MSGRRGVVEVSSRMLGSEAFAMEARTRFRLGNIATPSALSPGGSAHNPCKGLRRVSVSLSACLVNHYFRAGKVPDKCLFLGVKANENGDGDLASQRGQTQETECLQPPTLASPDTPASPPTKKNAPRTAVGKKSSPVCWGENDSSPPKTCKNPPSNPGVGGRCRDKSSYLRHVRSRVEEKLFTCSECGKGFTGSAQLERHARTHAREKACTCPKCGKPVSQKSGPKGQTGTSGKAKPSVCSGCEKIFSRAPKVTGPLRSRHLQRGFECEECGRLFSRRESVSRHSMIHTGEKPYPCPRCQRRFGRKEHLNRHRGADGMECKSRGKKSPKKAPFTNRDPEDKQSGGATKEPEADAKNFRIRAEGIKAEPEDPGFVDPDNMKMSSRLPNGVEEEPKDPQFQYADNMESDKLPNWVKAEPGHVADADNTLAGGRPPNEIEVEREDPTLSVASVTPPNETEAEPEEPNNMASDKVPTWIKTEPQHPTFTGVDNMNASSRLSNGIPLEPENPEFLNANSTASAKLPNWIKVEPGHPELPFVDNMAHSKLPNWTNAEPENLTFSDVDHTLTSARLPNMINAEPEEPTFADADSTLTSTRLPSGAEVEPEDPGFSDAHNTMAGSSFRNVIAAEPQHPESPYATIMTGGKLPNLMKAEPGHTKFSDPENTVTSASPPNGIQVEPENPEFPYSNNLISDKLPNWIKIEPEDPKYVDNTLTSARLPKGIEVEPEDPEVPYSNNTVNDKLLNWIRTEPEQPTFPDVANTKTSSKLPNWIKIEPEDPEFAAQEARQPCVASTPDGSSPKTLDDVTRQEPSSNNGLEYSAERGFLERFTYRAQPSEEVRRVEEPNAWQEGKLYACLKCGRQFSRCIQLEMHLKVHGGDRPHICQRCGKGFHKKKHLARHEKTHSGEKPFPCLTCGKRFSRKDHLSRHQKIRGSRCTANSKLFGEPQQNKKLPGRNHNRSVAKEYGKEQVVQGGHAVARRADVFDWPDTDLSAHEPAIRLRKDRQASPAGPDRQDWSHLRESLYKDKAYGESVNDGYSYLRHQSTHAGESAYGKGLTQLSQMVTHRWTNPAESRNSERGKNFYLNPEQVTPRRTPSEEKPYNCEECGMRFSDYPEFVIHQQRHEEENLLSGNRWLSESMRAHIEERPYGCTECGKHFSEEENLLLHQHSHRGKWPYRCFNCGKTFSQEKHLLRHERFQRECSKAVAGVF